jgi:hypothetical protein
MKSLATVSAAIALTLAASTAAAQDVSTNAYMMTAPQFNAAMYNPNFVMGPILEDRHSKQGGARSLARSPKAVPLPVHALAPNASPMPSKLAADYPVQARPQAERVFREMLVRHPQLMRQLGVPASDMAAGVATFIAGSYMAYRNVDFPDQHFKPLVDQMRQILGSNPDIVRASSAEKQEMFEQMAILGTFMATTQMALKERPNAQVTANMRQAAKGYLEQFLKTDAERVQITAQGLTLR